MLHVSKILNLIQKQALEDEVLKERFLKTRTDPNSLSAFCALCRELGYDIYPMDVIAASEEEYAADCSLSMLLLEAHYFRTFRPSIRPGLFTASRLRITFPLIA